MYVCVYIHIYIYGHGHGHRDRDRDRDSNHESFTLNAFMHAYTHTCTHTHTYSHTNRTHKPPLIHTYTHTNTHLQLHTANGLPRHISSLIWACVNIHNTFPLLTWNPQAFHRRVPRPRVVAVVWQRSRRIRGITRLFLRTLGGEWGTHE